MQYQTRSRRERVHGWQAIRVQSRNYCPTQQTIDEDRQLWQKDRQLQKNPKQVEEQKHTTEERDMQVHKWTHRVLKRAECFHTQVSCTRRQYDI